MDTAPTSLLLEGRQPPGAAGVDVEPSLPEDGSLGRSLRRRVGLGLRVRGPRRPQRRPHLWPQLWPQLWPHLWPHLWPQLRPRAGAWPLAGCSGPHLQELQGGQPLQQQHRGPASLDNVYWVMNRCSKITLAICVTERSVRVKVKVWQSDRRGSVKPHYWVSLEVGVTIAAAPLVMWCPGSRLAVTTLSRCHVWRGVRDHTFTRIRHPINIIKGEF